MKQHNRDKYKVKKFKTEQGESRLEQGESKIEQGESRIEQE